MAFPGRGENGLASVWSRLQGAAGRIRDRAQAFIGNAAISRRDALEFHNYLLDVRAQMELLVTAPGLQTYGQNEINTPSLNLATEYTAMRDAIDVVLLWLIANFPNTTGELRVYTFTSNRVSDIALNPSELSAYKAQLGSLANTIS